jgi:hypothetical protein
MASTINATTSGVVTTGDSVATLSLQTGGTTAVAIDTAQIVTLSKSLALLGSTSGSVALAAPATAGTQSYTLPTAQPTADGLALTATKLGAMSWAAPTATAAGSDTQVQYNNGGTAFGAASTFTFNNSTGVVSATGFTGAHNGTVGATTPAAGTFTSTVHKGSSSGTVTLTAPATAGTQSYTLPTAQPTADGQALVSTIAGAMSWTTVGGGSAATPTALGTVYGNTPGISGSVGIGYQALNSVSAIDGVGIGYRALQSLTSGDSNTAVGYNAGRLMTTGGFSTFVGAGAGDTCTGNSNTLIGRASGNGLTSGANNIYIGPVASPSSATITNEIVIATNGSSGKGTTTGFITAGAGGMYQGNNSAAWSVTSDQRLKKNIVDNNVGLDAIKAIQVRNFEYRLPEEVDSELKPNDAVEKVGVQLGVIAQELQAVLPDCVKQESTGVLSVDSDNLTWYTINAIKQLSAALDAANARIAALEAK